MLQRPRILLVVGPSADADQLIHQLSIEGIQATWQQVKLNEKFRNELGNDRWDLILADESLSKSDQTETISMVRRYSPFLPIIMLIHGDSGIDAVELLRAGANNVADRQNPAFIALAIERELRGLEADRILHSSESAREALIKSLRERVKELGTLHRVLRVLQQRDEPLDRTLQLVVEEIAKGWQFPEITEVRLTLGDQQFQTAKYQTTSWKQTTTFKTFHGTSGTLEVVYRKERPPAYEGPFLKEEFELLESLVESIQREINLRRTMQALEERETMFSNAKRLAEIGSWSLELNSNRLCWSRQAVTIFGLSPETFDGQFETFVQLVHESDRDEFLNFIAAAKLPDSVREHEFRIVLPDGEERLLQQRCEATLSRPDNSGCLTGVVWDITEQRRKAQELEHSTSLLRAVTEQIPDAIFVKNEQGQYLLFNPAAAKIVGKPAHEVLGNNDTAIFNAEDARNVMNNDQFVMSSGETLTTEEQLTIAGEPHTYLATKTPYRDSSGNIIGVVGISRDITATKLQDVALKRSDERFRLFMNHLPAAAFIKDEANRYVYGNKFWEELFPVQMQDQLGKTDFELFPPEVAEILTESDRMCREAKGTIRREESFQTGEGLLTYWMVTKTPFLLNGKEHVAGLAWNITEQKRAGEAIQLRDRAIRAVKQGILITDPNQPDNPIIFAGEGISQMTGYSREELEGQNCRILQGENTDPAAVAAIRRAVNRGESIEIEILNYRKDGTSFWNELTIDPIFNDDGKLAHFVGIQNDVSQRRRLEEQFRQAQKMEAVGQLAGGIAHDFNNLLTVINGCSELLLEESDPAHLSHYLISEIHKAGQESTKLTRQLLAFSRRQVASFEILSMNTLIENCRGMLQRMIGETVSLVTDLSAKLHTVRADPGQIEQVLLNLILNARDAMPEGGDVTIRTSNVKFASTKEDVLCDDEQGDYVLLEVSDTGCGMTADVKPRIFEPFFTTKKSGEGTGLGLAVVHGIVEQMGGQIKVNTAPDKGTCIQVIFQPSLASVTEKVDRQTFDLPKGDETVLLVEDEAAVRSLAKHILKMCGYKVLEAENGEEAIRLVEQCTDQIDLLIVDLVMPKLGGREAASELTKHRPNLKTIFMSGYTDDSNVRLDVLYGRVNFLNKPFSPRELSRKVRDVLDS